MSADSDGKTVEGTPPVISNDSGVGEEGPQNTNNQLEELVSAPMTHPQ